ncbi:hypothetical protein V501_06806 [Pseudogymnoascus sp. VKM F-4519 (FW-2642)]|nr:hypothetical protein V501_06806 [Pseudogymnoascus sp. VKM F-4519 (FW-2642)]
MKDGRSVVVVVVVAAAVDKSSGANCRAGIQRDGPVAGSNPVQQATSQSIIHNSVAIKEPTLSLTMELESKLPCFAFCNRGESPSKLTRPAYPTLAGRDFMSHYWLVDESWTKR